jgi:DNA-binding transcriptional LysR family regulator
MPIDDTDRLARHLKLGELRAIAEIARSGSILGAAAVLGSSQPALTRTLAAAEEKLGVTLFERLPRGVAPTLFGEALLQRIASIFHEIRGAAEDIAALRDLTQGTVSVGAMPLAAAGLLPEALSRLVAARPGLRAEVIEGNPEILLGELRRRRIEIVVGRVPPLERDVDLQWEALYEEEVVVIAAQGHPLQRRRRLTLPDLADEAWVLPPPYTAFYGQVAATFDAAGAPLPRHRIRTLSSPVSQGLVMRTNALAFVPASLLALGYLAPTIRPLDVALPRMTGSVGFVRLAGASETPALREFVDWTRAVAREIGERGAARASARRRRDSPGTPSRPRRVAGRAGR